MTIHSYHEDTHTHGLADDCERCQELAEHPESSLDEENTRRLWAGRIYTLTDVRAARKLREAGEERA